VCGLEAQVGIPVTERPSGALGTQVLTTECPHHQYQEARMYLKGSLCVLALVWLATPPAQAATELNGDVGRELIGQDEIPTEYHGLWGREGNCAELQQPFFMNAVFVTKKSMAFDKRTCPINTALAEGDEFKAVFNCITVGEDTLQTLPIRLTLREARLYVKVGEEREDGPYLNCNAPGFGSNR